MLFFSIILGKLSAYFIKVLLNRNASTWPGHLALELNKKFIKQTLNKNKHLNLVLIAGTNGKTTTTKALHHILKSNNIPVVLNNTGANLLNGLASLLLKEANTNGVINKDALLFEVDENSLPLILQESNPSAVILLNLFRDQLDRYGEINTTSEKWANAIKSLSKKTTIIANADDPQIVRIAKSANGKTYYYSIADKLKKERELSHAVDSTTCPDCRNSLKYSKIAYSHIGNFSCPKCGFKNPKAENFEMITSLKGSFNIYNLTASALTAERVFNIEKNSILSNLEDFKPAFGRQEEITYKGKKIIVLLSKNPTGFNESLKIVLENKYTNLLILLNDRIPDGRDISWIWDVDFELLSNKKLNITVSGDRTYDMANRLHYANIKSNPIANTKSALQNTLQKTINDETLVILPTYSAMLKIRKILTGKSIL